MKGAGERLPPSQEIKKAADWVYDGIWGTLVTWFKLPGEPPTLPVAPGEEVESFKPARKFLEYLRFKFWLSLMAPLALLVFLLSIAAGKEGWWLGVILFLIGLPILGVHSVLEYIALHLRYDTTWYVMTKTSLRIRHGIWVIREMTLTFENVQNVKIQQGPLQKVFGVSDLIVWTAGSGESEKKGIRLPSNRGVIAGITDPKRLQALIQARMSHRGSAGLGDEKSESPRPLGLTEQHLTVLREIRDEILKLYPGQRSGRSLAGPCPPPGQRRE